MSRGPLLREIEERAGRKYAPNQVLLAKEIGLSVPWIRKHMKHPQCPGATEKDDYDIEAWKKFVGEVGSDLSKEKAENPDQIFENKKTKDELTRDKIAEEVRKLKLQNAEAEGRVVDLEEAKRVFSEIARAFKAEVMAIKDRESHNLSGLSQAEVAARLREISRGVLDTLALGDWAQKKTFWSELYAIQSDLLKS